MSTRYYQQKALSHARALRRNATPQERRLWYDFLAQHPVRFQRQKPIGSYIVDFYCHDARLVIELDGGQHYTPEALAYDAQRTQALQSLGLTVLRFTNQEIDRQLPAVCNTINAALDQRLNQRKEE